ncbi:HEAT repeat domain-containing protein [Schumannella luteola]
MSDATPSDLSAPTEARLAEAVSHWGETGVVDRAVALIGGLSAGDDFLLFVGGTHAQGVLEGAPVLYWPEVWGMRTLLYVWDDSAADAVRSGLQNQAWRVREMAARVTAARSLLHTAELLELLTDDVARVRAAAARALGAVGSAGEGESIRPLLRDKEIDVRRAAQQALDALSSRS